MEIGLNINPDRDGIENAAQIPSSEWRTFVFGNCLVTCSLLEEFLPQRDASTAMEALTISPPNAQARAGKGRKKKKKKKRKQANQAQTSNFAAVAAVETTKPAPQKHIWRPSVPFSWMMNAAELHAFAASMLQGKAAVKSLLRPKPAGGTAAIKRLLSASDLMAQSALPGAKRSRTERLSHRLKGPAPPSPSHPEGNAGLSQAENMETDFLDGDLRKETSLEDLVSKEPTGRAEASEAHLLKELSAAAAAAAKRENPLELQLELTDDEAGGAQMTGRHPVVGAPDMVSGQAADLLAAAAIAEAAQDVAEHTVRATPPADSSLLGAQGLELDPEQMEHIDFYNGEGRLEANDDVAVETALGIAAHIAADEEPTAANTSISLQAVDTLQDEPQLQDLGAHGSLTTYEMCKKVRLQKYWAQRYSLWSRFDEGILMDPEGWYSATPEVLAKHHADRLACNVAVDAMCGVGGNAVQLAGSCQQVIAVDTNFERLLLAKHNAGVYGISHRIEFLCGDFLKLAPRFQADAVFISPPWGGPDYSRGSFQVNQNIGGLGISLEELFRVADSALHRPILRLSPDGFKSRSQENEAEGKGLACFLPKASSLQQISEAVPPGCFCEVERNLINGRLKSVTVYVGLPEV